MIMRWKKRCCGKMGSGKVILVSLILILCTMGVQARETVFSVQQELRIDLVRIDPSPLVPGGSSEVLLEVKNLKDVPFYNSRFSLTDEFPVYIDSDPVTIPVMQPGETKELRFRIHADPAAQEGSFKTTLQYDVKELKIVATARINVTVKKSKTLIATGVVTDPERGEPGSEMKVKLTLKNTADSDLKDVNVRLDFSNASLPFAPLAATSERVVKLLRVGEEQTVEFLLLVSPDAGLNVYRLPVSVRFFDDLGKEFTSQDVLGIVVDAVPEYSLALEQTDLFTSGERGKVAVTLSNVGVADMKFVALTLLEGEGYSILSKKNVYVGNLESDDFETEDFDVFIDGYKGVVPLKFLVQYKDVYNKDYGAEQVVPLKLYSDVEAKRLGLKSNGNAVWLVVGVILVLIGVVVVYRKRKKMPLL